MYIRSSGQQREVTFIDEPNLYRVIFRSNKKEAIQFQNWIFEEVLPSIRKTGSYSVPQQPYDANNLNGPDQVITHSDMMNIHGVCGHMRWLCGWWYQFGPAIRALNSNMAASLHDRFIDGSFRASSLIDKFNFEAHSHEYVKSYPFDKSTAEKHRYDMTRK